jgi:hypothetical protein
MQNFTPKQLEEQRRVMHEDIFNFITQVMNMYSHSWTGWVMDKMNTCIQSRRRKLNSGMQKALNAQKKEILLKKRDTLNELEKYDKVQEKAPYPTSFSSKEIVVADIAKKRRVGTMLVKPTNIMLHALKAETTPSNINVRP